jgi:NitT/TauT family transport system permease protein
MGLSTTVRFCLGPLVTATFPTPKLAIFPLLIVIFGLGDASKIALITLGVFYMTCLSTVSGVLYSNPLHRDVARAFRIPAWTRWSRIVVPAALPSIVTGLKLGLGQALILVVSAEFVAAQEGLGHFIWDSWQVLDVSRMFMGLFVVAITGGGAVLLGEMMERRLTPWVTH